jgi:hypothetical protein
MAAIDPRAKARQLNAAAWWLNKVSAWLGSCGCETQADMAETAARNLAAAC